MVVAALDPGWVVVVVVVVPEPVAALVVGCDEVPPVPVFFDAFNSISACLIRLSTIFMSS